ncbi:hypothetical protein RIF29_06061 [Crotalaria pallida]|uniref:TF-B3 domain-containing protein n=1 Tax=Crotalaria pallida TaxID=3830 RepID=A0AAN9J2S4_CROPI
MKGGSNSDENCRSWVEDIYWTHFKSLHFAQFLRPGFDQLLALPKTFSDNLKKKLPENVSLRGPSGVVWNAGLTTKDDVVHFMNGWKQFVKDHSLKEDDFLVFKYNGESLFDVLIFDGGSFCEKAASYFVRKCGYTDNGGVRLITGEVTDNSAEEVNNNLSDAGARCASPEKSEDANNVTVLDALPLKTPTEKGFNAGVESASPLRYVEPERVAAPAAVPPLTTGKRIRKQLYAVKPVQTKRKGRKANVASANLDEVDWVSDPEPSSVGKSRTPDMSYISNRRLVTEDEIKNALALAQEACTNGSLYIVMRPTHVYKRFYVSLPNKWIFEHISPKSQNVILRMGGTEWLAKYSLHNIRHTGGLTGGWKHFAVDNNLEEFDVCVFKPAGHINNTLILDVSIFRVVEEFTPLSMVGSPGKRGKKK